jgi:type IV pilus assembly protein PilV
MKIMHKQHGFSLLEALITLLIISLGLLGIAGIIANSLKVNQGAYVRSQASWLANDIIDRMRANRITAESAGLPYNLSIGTDPAGGGIPLADLTAWRAALASALPSGTGGVALDAATRKVTVTVQWDDTRAAGGEDDQQFVVETRL